MKGFFAYPASVPSAETIRTAIAEVKQFHAVSDLIGWEELDIPGQFIAQQVLHKIDQSDFLVADITVLNFNVTYEVGYAIGRGKRVVLVRNSGFLGLADEGIKRLGIYDTLGFETYQNARELAAKIKLYRDRQSLLRDSKIDVNQPIYVTKTRTQSDYAIRIAARLKKSGLGLRSFDPAEQPRLSALDAINQVQKSIGVLVHFIPSAMDDAPVHNLRAAFIAGLAEGMSKHRLLLQETHDPVPMDYRDLVTVLVHPSKIDEVVADLAGEVVSSIGDPLTEADSTTGSLIERLHFGASSAENEITDLPEYYLDTDEFRRALRGEVRLIVGRKGTGKSAVFFRVRDKISSTRRNVVLDLKPDGYQLVKFKSRVLSVMDQGTQEHTITAFWQSVLLLEVARAALHLDKESHRLDDEIYPVYRQLEEKYKEYGYDSGQGDFAERVTSLIYRIEGRFDAGSQPNEVSLSTPEVTALIYDQDITKLNAALLAYLQKKDSIWILFDNIDKGWTPTGIDASDIVTLKALLEATRKLQRTFAHNGIDAKTLVFIRNDVYELLVSQTADRGKEQKVVVDWRDPDALKQLVYLRIVASLPELADENFDDLWARLAVRHVNGEDSYQYIVDRCLMRPRYLIELLKYARGCALTLRHEKITEDDILKAEAVFSTDLVQDTNLELRDVFPQYEGLLYAFIGSPWECSLEDLRVRLVVAKVEEKDVDRVIQLLQWYAVIGVRNEDFEPTYIYDKSYSLAIFEAYFRARHENGGVVIHPGFRRGLDLKAH
ncbi:hypothetical protein [Luteimonas sp. MC1895]|uniref:P-loop ATPase, Sll1717 family n=1 Tax=Luteimonas sp. MC1895 TaxID=2819513 RepID=UPI0018F10853|nr:hypothetical protein [Luteimonas sp. MC1895]MBJ6979451.1 hypothetical protein [Luteimonas sp. MC1895]